MISAVTEETRLYFFNAYEPFKFKGTPWKYNTRRNVDLDFSIVTMRRVAIIFFELGVVKNSMQKF